MGLSGNKAHHADLTVELGFSSDMGVTNSRYPEEICEGQLQMDQGSMMGLSYDQLDGPRKIWKMLTFICRAWVFLLVAM